MTYSPNTWSTGDIITKDKLDRIEAGLVGALDTPVVSPVPGQVLMADTTQSWAWSSAYTTQPLPLVDALQRRTIKELRTFTDWCEAQGTRGYVGEFGITVAGAQADRVQWLDLLARYYSHLDHTGTHATQWAAGRGWDTYNLGTFVNTTSGGDISLTTPSGALLARMLENNLTGWRGSCLAGFEFPVAGNGGTNVRTGYHFIHSAADFAYLASRNVRTVRLAVAWEWLQQSLGGALHTPALAELDSILARAHAAGIRVILDLHNYGRYTESDNTTVRVLGPSGVLTQTQLADFWSRMVAWVKADAARSATVLAYDLMNEPHDLGANAGTYTSAATLDTFNAGTGPDRTAGGSSGSRAFTASAPGLVELGYETADFTGRTHLGVWLRLQPGAVYTSVKFQLVNMAYNYIDITADIPLTADGTWRQFFLPIPADMRGAGGTVHRQLCIYVGGVSGTKTLYMDDLTAGSLTGATTAAYTWEQASQTALTAIRDAGDRRLVSVAGYDYSRLEKWTVTHPQGWITDPARNFVYQAHHYWDTQSTSGARSGTYVNGANPLTYATELAAAVSAGA